MTKRQLRELAHLDVAVRVKLRRGRGRVPQRRVELSERRTRLLVLKRRDAVFHFDQHQVVAEVLDQHTAATRGAGSRQGTASAVRGRSVRARTRLGKGVAYYSPKSFAGSAGGWLPVQYPLGSAIGSVSRIVS